MSYPKDTIIVAPHPDDEIIGCFEIIEKTIELGGNTFVLYANDTELPEWALNGENPLNISPITKEYMNLYLEIFNPEEVMFLFPDPIYEFHPQHRKYGHIGEKMLRRGNNVVFYNINMQAPYIREVRAPDRKREILNLYYPKKADLWEYDHKYFLFEGQVKWLGGMYKWQD